MNAMKDITVPSDLRKGQTLFLFLSWMGQRKPVPIMDMSQKADAKGNTTHFQLGDPFNVPDQVLEDYWAEFIADLERKYISTAKTEETSGQKA